MRRSWLIGIVGLVIGTPIVALALYPPTGFDETTYHLPLVRSIAEDGLRFNEDLRFPLFPLLGDLLAVPAYLIGGDIATHAIPLIATLCTALVLLAWGRLRGIRAGVLPAAAYLGAPIVVHLATSLYVEAVTTLFVTAGFYCIDRAFASCAHAANSSHREIAPHPPSGPSPHRDETAMGRGLPNDDFREGQAGEAAMGRGLPNDDPGDAHGQVAFSPGEGRIEPRAISLICAGLFLGAACAVKYLGLYFAAAGAVAIFLRARPRFRTTALYLLGVLVTGLPTYAWIYAVTGNPLYPYFSFSPNEWTADLPAIGSWSEWLVRFIRIPWDFLFARERIGMQPPFSPFFPLALAAIVWRSKKNILLPLGYLLAFTFLPRDSRYLVPLLPLVLMEGATVLDTIAMPRWILTALVILAILPGPAYAVYRLAKQGPIPLNASQRTAYLQRRVPEYRALQRAGRSRVYNCGAEQLKWHAAGPFSGDHFGPYNYARVLDHGRDIARIHKNLVALHIDHLLVAKRNCTWLPLPASGFTLVYEDEAAQLWHVDQE